MLITEAFASVSPVNVPTEVMFGCAAVVTVPAVVALVTEILYDPVSLPLGTVPVDKLFASIFVSRYHYLQIYPCSR